MKKLEDQVNSIANMEDFLNFVCQLVRMRRITLMSGQIQLSQIS